jgi:hypothetical protein
MEDRDSDLEWGGWRGGAEGETVVELGAVRRWHLIIEVRVCGVRDISHCRL